MIILLVIYIVGFVATMVYDLFYSSHKNGPPVVITATFWPLCGTVVALNWIVCSLENIKFNRLNKK